MRYAPRMRKIGYLGLLALLHAGCDGKAPAPAAPAPRPVKVITLETINPVEPLLLTGSVESWKEQALSFEVSGRVEFVVETATYLEGRWEEGGEIRAKGQVVARLDSLTYEIAHEQAEAAVDVAKEKLATAKVELNDVLPADVRRAEAQLARAEAEFVRTKQAAESGAVPELELIRSTADRDSRQAELDQAKAAIARKQAEIKALEADLRTAEENRRQAEFDLSRCELWAPFSGEVSEVFVEAGGYARRGQPVARLVMMSPIKVDIAVSQATAAEISRGDVVRLYVPGVEEPRHGAIYEKATVADPDTRTFRVSVITRNILIETPFGKDDPRSKLPRIAHMIPLLPVVDGETYAVEAKRSLKEDADGHYIWANPEYTFDTPLPDGTVLHLTRHRVVPGDRVANLQGLYLVQELEDVGDLPLGTQIPLDVPDTDADEIDVVISKPQWMLKPGQLVPVLLAERAPPAGIYVPMNILSPIDDNHGVLFLAVDGAARRVEVSIKARVRQLVRVEGEGIEEGAEVIADAVHFLEDGEPVRVIRRQEIGR